MLVCRMSAGRARPTISAPRTSGPTLRCCHRLCDLLDVGKPRRDGKSYRELMTFVKDWPGHDSRYGIDAGKIEGELGWRPAETFESGLRKTVSFENQEWVTNVTSDAYRDWIARHYGERASAAQGYHRNRGRLE
jgi:dTDP-D-glucose 4,6-dehydratase